MAPSTLARFADAYDHPSQVAARWRESGGRVARQLGVDVPREMVLAAGILPVRLVGVTSVAAPAAHRVIDAATLGQRGRSLLEQILTEAPGDALIISHADAELPQLFSTLRELARMDDVSIGSAYFIDLLHLPRTSSARYNRTRLEQLRVQLQEGAGRTIDATSLRDAIATSNEQKRLLAEVATLRVCSEPRLTGTQMLTIIGSAAILPQDEHLALLRQLLATTSVLPHHSARRVFVTGSNQESTEFYSLLEACGGIVAGEDHDWGDPWYSAQLSETIDPMEALADPSRHVTVAARSTYARQTSLAAGIARSKAEVVVHVTREGDEAAAWEVRETRRFCEDNGVPLLCVDLPDSPFALSMSKRSESEPTQLHSELRSFLSDPNISREPAAIPAAIEPETSQTSSPRPKPTEAGQRSRKSLASVANFGTYQREWFASVQQRASAGDAFAVVNANAPQEILRALDIPFVVNQWWASIVAAKQQSGRYLELLRQHGYPTDVDAYSSQGIAAALDRNTAAAPWGGLPTPTLLHAFTSTDSTGKLFEAWARETNAELFLFERTIESRWSISQRWWEELPDRWDETLEVERLDLLVAELRTLIRDLEKTTGRNFSVERFVEVMQLVNEQEEYYRRTRDLIAGSTPAPVSIADTMPATMVPQWHRGTVWARDAARAFYEEVAGRVARGEAACANERVRLMWVGRGMWSEMGLYQRWEQSHGAVFVWSMYLALAADGYIRTFDRGRDPLRALAARFLTMGDELRMPTWAGPWHVREAQTHGVDGAIALSDADPFVVSALQRAGIPVLALHVDNFNKENVDWSALEQQVTQFIEGPVTQRASAQRRAGVSNS
jgi:benzoyl-CoA reductase/2-hydroxyglutaryl-CoA dehydratase subunit BcrC/BadD/HgdB